MNNLNTLKDLKQGQAATVKSLLSTGSIRKRLQHIGLIEGTRVECLQKSPYHYIIDRDMGLSFCQSITVYEF